MPSATGLYYFSFGEENTTRPPVIFIHGAGGDHQAWPPQIRRLPHQRLFVVDLPGHGKSEGFGCQSVADYAASLIYFLDGLRLPRAIFVGHSMGSAIALHMTLHHPDRTLGLGMVGGGARLRVSPELLDIASNPATFELAVKAVHQGSYSSHADPRLVELSTKRMRQLRPTVLHGDFLACDAFDEMVNLSDVHVPTLLVCGRDDKMTPPRYSEYLAGVIPGAKLLVVPEAGHMVQLEKPDEVAAALEEFLESIPYQPGQ